ncbi:ComF family protein [Desulfospira joergensenii]|uniref:ComF family protein n=1 Tax=Desulfospira joergensenii TaxID=53329 RepID=UPI0003B62252|nr:ComF family protein [Desulfospira joergensenii]
MLPVFKKSFVRSVSRRFQPVSDLVQTLLFPPRCLKCGTYMDSGTADPSAFSAYFCKSCLGSGPRPFEPPFCPWCGHVFDQGENHLCEACLKKNPRFRRISRVRASLVYSGVVKEAVPLFKYQSRLSLARPFERVLFRAFETYFMEPEPDLVLPVPLHVRRLRQRGFNQAYFLVRHFPDLYFRKFHRNPSWQVDIASLKRVVHTRPQTGLDEKSRRKNLRNAFQVSPKAQSRIKKARVLLIDDVFTTGSTCREAARVLFRHGADRVDVLVLARA